MSIKIACMKGCGDSILVTDEQMAEFAALGAPIEAAHEVCPRDRVEKDTYHVLVSVHRIRTDEDPVLLAQAGAKVEATSFDDGLTQITNDLQKSWEKVAEMSKVADKD